MSTIYNLEPHAHGLIVFKTTFGDLELELFTRQCPKNTKNFVQLCLDGYYVGTTFERVEKDFIAIGGELDLPGADSIELDVAPDEFHSRLKFSRRGLLATANTEKNVNGPKFFFTLGPAPELQNKHTIFGRVKGDSVYHLVDLNECHVDEDLRPIGDKKIIQVIVAENPYPELTSRSHFKEILDNLRGAGRETEDGNEVYADASSTEYLEPKFDLKKSKKLSFYEDSDDDEDEEEDEAARTGSKIDEDPKVNEASARGSQDEVASKSHELVNDSPNTDVKLELSEDARQKKLREIREQIKKLKQKLVEDSGTKSSSRSDRESRSDVTSETGANSSNMIDLDSTSSSQKVRLATKKGLQRERETIELMQNFKKKLKNASTISKQRRSNDEMSQQDDERTAGEDEATELALDMVDDDNWLHHRFDADNTSGSLAKDANTKGDDWYSIDDPRNPIVNRVEMEKAKEYKRHKERDRHRDDYDSHDKRHRSERHKSSRHHYR